MIINKKSFQEALKSAAPLISSSPVIPILDHVVISQGRLQATNLSISVDVAFRYEATLEEFKPIAVPFKDLSKLIDASGDHIELNSYGLKLQAISGRSRSTITGEAASDFPAMIQNDATEANELIAEDVRYIANTVTKFASTDDLRLSMCGVMFNGTKFVATDAHRLIHYTVDGEQTPEIIIPTKVFQVLSPLIAHEDKVYIAGNMFRTENAIVTFKPIDQKYPSWQSILPSKGEFTEFNRLDMLQAVKFASIGANDSVFLIVLQGDGQQIRVAAQDLDFGKSAETTIDGTGVFKLGVNLKFLTTALQSTDDQKIRMYYSQPTRPMLLTSDNWQGEVLLMPMMIQES